MITVEKVFDFDNTQVSVRIHLINNKEYFCASDVCKILQYSNSRDAISKNCEPDGVANSDIIDSLGRKQKATFINEPNLYRLIIKSKLPKAKEFEKIENQQKSEIITEQELELERKAKTINRFIGIDKEIVPSEAGKILGLHPHKFVAKLKEYGYYINDAPYQLYITKGYFVLKYTEPKFTNGEWRKYPRFFITPKGFKHFTEKLEEGLFDEIKVDVKEKRIINKTY